MPLELTLDQAATSVPLWLWFWLWLVEPASSFNLCVRTDRQAPLGGKPSHDDKA
jgi:hypothetical protein